MFSYKMRPSNSIAYLFRKTGLSSVLLKRQVHIQKIVVASTFREREQQRRLPREGHVIPWDNLRGNYVDANCHLFTTLAALRVCVFPQGGMLL